MQECYALSRLPRALKRSPAVLYRHQNPGLLGASTRPSVFLDLRSVVDPTHPGTKLSPRDVPSYYSSILSLYAFPVNLLSKPKFPFSVPFERSLDTYEQRIQRGLAQYEADPRQDFTVSPLQLPTTGKRFPVCMFVASSVKAVKSRYIARTVMARKIKCAVGLIVSRNAKAHKEPDGSVSLVFGSKITEDFLPMKGWAYVVWPNITVYRMKYPQLVLELTKALRIVRQKAGELENQWESATMNQLKNDRVLSTSLLKGWVTSIAKKAPREPSDPLSPDFDIDAFLYGDQSKTFNTQRKNMSGLSSFTGEHAEPNPQPTSDDIPGGNQPPEHQRKQLALRDWRYKALKSSARGARFRIEHSSVDPDISSNWHHNAQGNSYMSGEGSESWHASLSESGSTGQPKDSLSISEALKTRLSSDNPPTFLTANQRKFLRELSGRP